MDIRHLKFFVRVYELNSFSRAARSLGCAQSTVSLHITNLEKNLELLLFDRIGPRIMPTQAADILYEHANSLVAAFAFARAEVMAFGCDEPNDTSPGAGLSGTLRLCADTVSSCLFIPQLLADFTGQYARVNTELATDNSQAVIDAVSKGTVPVGITGIQGSDTGLVYELIAQEQLCLVAGAQTDFTQGVAAEKSSDRHLITHLPLILREQGSGTRKIFEQTLRPYGIAVSDLAVRAVVDTAEACVACIRAGLGAGVVPCATVRDMLDSGELRHVAVDGLGMSQKFFLVYPGNRHLFPLVRHFIAHCRQVSAIKNK